MKCQRHGLLWVTGLCSLILLFNALAAAAQCEDPHCMRLEDLPTERPARLVRSNALTGYATMASGAVIEDVPERDGRPQPKRVKIRKYPLDLSVKTTVSLGFGDILQFTHNNVKYVVSVVSFDEHNAQFKFMPTREFSNISPQENKVYDVDHDGTPDFSVTMGVVSGSQADFDIIPPHEFPLQDTMASLPRSQLIAPAPSQEIPTVLAPPPSPPLPPPPAPAYEAPSPYIPQVPIPPIARVEMPESAPEVLPESPPAESLTPPQGGTTLVTWGILLGLVGLVGIGLATYFVMKREQTHVETVIDYVLRSLGRKVPLSQSVDALSKAGWAKKTIDKALASVATRYKMDGAQKNQTEDQVRQQLAGAGMPEDVLNQVFKKKML